jgi:hypothetical protein
MTLLFNALQAVEPRQMFAQASRLLSWSSVETTPSKSVRFADDKDQLAMSSTYYSDDGFEDTWFTKDEYTEMKVSALATVSRINAGETLEPDQHTSRGLEFWTYEAICAKVQKRRTVCEAVIFEQGRQWEAREQDDDAIAALCSFYTERCVLGAAAKGKEDELAALQIFITQMVEDEQERVKLQPATEGTQFPLRRRHSNQSLCRAA